VSAAGSSPLPHVSVVVVAEHAAGQLVACLASIVRGQYPAERREIVVVHHGQVGETARGFPVRHVTAPANGVCAARNAGLHASQGEIVAFTDPDCVASDRWLTGLVQGFQDDGVAGVAGAIVPYPASTPAERYAARHASHSQARAMGHPLRPFAMTPNAAFRRDALETIGGFDVRFPGGGWEDADLCWRVTRPDGARLVEAPRAVVLHRYRTTARNFFVQHVRYGHGLGLIMRKWRAELPWTWRQGLRASGGLGSALLGVGRALRVGSPLEAGLPLDMAWLELLRRVGQRIGFLRGTLAARRLGL
jgi:GT2 family glycosyltransferase